MCKWCDKVPCASNQWREDVSNYIYYSGGSFYTSCGDSYYDLPIKYCPNCGRRLKLSTVFRDSQTKSKVSKTIPVATSATWGQLTKIIKEWS